MIKTTKGLANWIVDTEVVDNFWRYLQDNNQTQTAFFDNKERTAAAVYMFFLQELCNEKTIENYADCDDDSLFNIFYGISTMYSNHQSKHPLEDDLMTYEELNLCFDEIFTEINNYEDELTIEEVSDELITDNLFDLTDSIDIIIEKRNLDTITNFGAILRQEGLLDEKENNSLKNVRRNQLSQKTSQRSSQRSSQKIAETVTELPSRRTRKKYLDIYIPSLDESNEDDGNVSSPSNNDSVTKQHQSKEAANIIMNTVNSNDNNVLIELNRELNRKHDLIINLLSNKSQSINDSSNKPVKTKEEILNTAERINNVLASLDINHIATKDVNIILTLYNQL